ncbi:alpha/beta hydrolase family protein [Saccharibacillus kuerlensis]|uniref:Peptidase S9 prolyl oligopeptidase catalytic domain-containing protein n=1 Tax=Saccharibacillus kuerlensis TaxID=459527 RepID=A0ABQ2LA16_9BACL|nr:prolyl oligopeptidase family serine peptidase [Saccharibacillus kuerlensis]GGO06119.1 hypothetical protein GCM10010969_33190 [Saccharibacillus kuerlensis]
MIYRVTYLSDGLRVAGYVALPPELAATEEDIAAFLRRECGDDGLTAQAVACIMPQAVEMARRAMRCAPDYARGDIVTIDSDEVHESCAYEADIQANPQSKGEEWHHVKLHHSEQPLTKKSTYPVFVYCRGGIGRVGQVQLNWLAEFASFGHIVIAPCYRGGESGVGHDRFGGADLEDSRVAVRLARAIPWADPQRIAVMGFSRGSINATDAAIHEQVSQLILWGGLSDLAQTYEERIDLRRMLKRVVGGSAYKVPDIYQERSPIHMARQLECPVLIMHGTKDVQVLYEHGKHMYEELQRLGKPAVLARLEGMEHHVPHNIRLRVLAGMFRWLDQEA